jgi:hypothetical protein
MEKTFLQMRGRVAEMLEKDDVRQAKIICEATQLMVMVNDNGELELGGNVIIIGELKITSVMTDTTIADEMKQQ